MKHLWNILCRGSILTILLPSLLLIASAETVSFCDSIPMQLTDWNSSVTLPKFDPEMGTLTGVDLKSVLNLSQGISIENKNSRPSNYTISIFGGMIVLLPNSDNISININHSSSGNLSGFDGNVDSAGPSGVSTNEVIATEPALKNYSAINDFIGSSPGEKIALPVRVYLSSRMQLPGSADSGISTNSGATVCISYIYNRKATQEGGSS